MKASLTAIICLGSLAALTACGDQEPAVPATPAVEDKCPKVGMDAMTGRWIKVNGKAADKNFRFEFVQNGNAAELWYTGGGFTKRRLSGERREDDWKFTEVLDAAAEARFQSGDRSKVRLFVNPYKKQCSLRVTEVELVSEKGKEREKPKGTFVEYLEFPEGQDMSFRACDGPLWLGDAAKDGALAQKQVNENGSPDPGHSLGPAIPVGLWTDAAADGDAACTFDMDLFFDDRPARAADKSVRPPVPAGEVKDGKRSWLVPDWYAPYSGNHHFQIFRNKTCAGKRELIDVRCLEAVLD